MRPRIIILSDVLVTVLPGITTLALGVWLWDRPGAVLMMVGLCFLAVWVRVVRLRKQLVDSYPIVTKYKVLIKHNGYHITRLQAEEAISTMLRRYSMHWLDAEKALTSEFIWVEFVPGVITTPITPGTVRRLAGFLRVCGHYTKVACFNVNKQPDLTVSLDHTTFTHELGHIILGKVLGTWDEATHHKVMEEKRL
ncbi:MAG: hypothetical protein WC565_08590 [Parcubacteria group bacterium]|jgi:hypothetical protein